MYFHFCWHPKIKSTLLIPIPFCVSYVCVCVRVLVCGLSLRSFRAFLIAARHAFFFGLFWCCLRCSKHSKRTAHLHTPNSTRSCCILILFGLPLRFLELFVLVHENGKGKGKEKGNGEREREPPKLKRRKPKEFGIEAGGVECEIKEQLTIIKARQKIGNWRLPDCVILCI